MRSFLSYLAAAVLIAGPALPANAQPGPILLDWCYEIDHFPDQPIGDAPSKFTIFTTVPSEFAGGTFTFLFTGPSGDQVGFGPIDDRGLATAPAPLFQFGVHEFTEVFLELGGAMTSMDPSELGGVFFVGDAEVTCDPNSLTFAPTTTTAALTTTTSAPATTTTTAAASTTTTGSTKITTATTDTGGSGAFWPAILIAFGLGMLTLGWLLWHKPKDPCEELRKLWEAAELRVKLAEETLEKARKYLEEKRANTAEAKGELAKLERARMNSITEYGITYHLVEGGRMTTEGLEGQIASQTRLVESAEEIEASAAESVSEWEQHVQEYGASAAEAKAAYERCIGQPTASTPGTATGATGGTATGGTGGTATGGGTTTGGTGGPAVASTPQTETRECEEGKTEARPVGSSESINVTVDFSLFVEVEEGSERKVGEAKVLALDLSNLARELDTLGNLMDAFGAGQALGEAALSLKAGEYVEGALGVVEGGIGTYKAAADPSMGGESFDVFPPTSPADAAVEVLKCTAQLGALVASKVGEWMEMNQLYNIRLTYFYQTVTATPYQIWRCQAGHWVCVEKVFHYSVSGLQRRPGPRQGPFRLESDIARAQFQREIDRMVSAARGQLEQSARGRAEFNQRHRPGPCS